MIELTALDEADISLLEDSYNAIRNKDSVEIVSDLSEKQKITRKILSVISLPNNCVLSIQNLLKLKLTNGQFFIAQCLLDYDYPVSRKLSQSFDREYKYQLVAVAESNVDLGKTLLRPEITSDKIVGRFLKTDIDIANAHHFNNKYYLISNKEEQILRVFTKGFLDAISSSENIYLFTRGKDIFLTFDSDLEPQHSRIAEEVFLNFRFLASLPT